MKLNISFSVLLFLAGMFSRPAFAQNQGESLESIVKRAIGQGVMKRDGNTLIYMASPAQDTLKIRSYYEDLIKKAGSPFVFRFDKTPAVKQPVEPEKTQVVVAQEVPAVQINSNIRTPVIDQRSASYTHQNVFGQLHYTDRVEHYTWTVPEGVGQIWIEAWSGGGHGQSKFIKAPSDTNQIIAVPGGGGGGGAYASVMLSVQKGERLLITIPPGGGGGTLEIQLNDKNNVLYLNNGGNGNAEDELKGKGRGGVSGGNYGRFTNENVFWVGGQNGGVISDAHYRYEPSRQSFGQSTATINEISIGNFGNGGAAAYMNNGGRGAKLNDLPFAGYAPGQNGGFPGGGGGGGELGINTYGGWYGPGKGAPGVVIIHF